MNASGLSDARQIPDEVMNYLRRIAVRAVEEQAAQSGTDRRDFRDQSQQYLRLAAPVSGGGRSGLGDPVGAGRAAHDHGGLAVVVAENRVAVDAGGPRLRHGALDPQDSGGVAGAAVWGSGGGIDGGPAPAGAGLALPTAL
ncbi:MAG: hypothetical protein MZV65_35800 [Chromatiales bacterium]|nr:hypothetical protein [Chromatiales bacterium]